MIILISLFLGGFESIWWILKIYYDSWTWGASYTWVCWNYAVCSLKTWGASYTWVRLIHETVRYIYFWFSQVIFASRGEGTSNPSSFNTFVVAWNSDACALCRNHVVTMLRWSRKNAPRLQHPQNWYQDVHIKWPTGWFEPGAFAERDNTQRRYNRIHCNGTRIRCEDANTKALSKIYLIIQLICCSSLFLSSLLCVFRGRQQKQKNSQMF